jgi:hypothetical protein
VVKRRATNFLIACSALLCLASAAMWCRSHYRNDRLTYTFGQPRGQWVIDRHRFVLTTPPGIAKAVEAISVGSGDGRIILTHIGFVIPRGQRLLQPGEPEPDYAADFPYNAARDTGFAIEHPPEPRWVSRGFATRRTLGFARAEGSWMMSFSYWAAPAWLVHGEEYEIPFWVLILTFAIPPALRIVNVARRRRRFGAGRCQACGYDLRATPERCPECGAAAAPVTAATAVIPRAGQ